MPGYCLNFTCFLCSNRGEPASYICKNPELDGVTQVTCPKCNSVIILRNQATQFEIYLQCAIEQFLQDNYAETVFLLSKSREAFFEFVVGLLLYEKDNAMFSSEPLNKFGANLSERRLGFFAALYFCRFNEIINIQREISLELRNKVLHSYMYPQEEKVIKLGNNVLLLFYKVITKIKETIPNDIVFGYIHKLQETKLSDYLQTFKNSSPQMQTCSDAIDLFARPIDETIDFLKWCSIIAKNNEGLRTHSDRIKQ